MASKFRYSIIPLPSMAEILEFDRKMYGSDKYRLSQFLLGVSDQFMSVGTLVQCLLVSLGEEGIGERNRERIGEEGMGFVLLLV